MLESRSKAKKTDSSLVSNENFSKILWPSGWALGQVTEPKWSKHHFTYDVTHKKSTTPNQKIFSSADEKTGWSIWAIEQLSSVIGRGTGVLVRQLKTDGLRPKSRYKWSYPGSQSVKFQKQNLIILISKHFEFFKLDQF